MATDKDEPEAAAGASGSEAGGNEEIHQSTTADIEGRGRSGDPAQRLRIEAAVKLLSVTAGLLLAICISLAARLDTGYPPGIEPQPFAPLLGLPAPGFEITGLDGDSVSLHTLTTAVKSQAGLLFFTNSACPACDATYPALKRAAAQMPVLVIGVGVEEDLRTKLAQHGLAVSAGHDSQFEVGDRYGVQVHPSTLLIDGDGVVLTAATGVRSVDRILEEWKDLRERRR